VSGRCTHWVRVAATVAVATGVSAVGIAAAVFAVAGLAGCQAAHLPHSACSPAARDPSALASWRAGAARDAIVSYVARTTVPGSPDFVPERDRIAVFDNDGTLWAEQPMYVQLAFVVDRIEALRASHPEWETTEPFASLLRGDHAAVAAQGEPGIAALVAATHGGMTPEQFRATVRDWLKTARHPATNRHYTEMAYQPMLEMLDYLRAHGFRTYIVSGGGTDFVRAFAEELYGIPREQVIGSTGTLAYHVHGGAPQIVKTGGIEFIDDGKGKPLAIESRIGTQPRIAFGNSDGDFEMLEWTTAGDGARLGVIIRHTDAEREWAYDRESRIGRLARALDEAPARGWVIVDMARDWSRVLP
jgi:phosphoglycolate phosphatase-like HAD superfamily hydrolase